MLAIPGLTKLSVGGWVELEACTNAYPHPSPLPTGEGVTHRPSSAFTSIHRYRSYFGSPWTTRRSGGTYPDFLSITSTHQLWLVAIE